MNNFDLNDVAAAIATAICSVLPNVTVFTCPEKTVMPTPSAYITLANSAMTGQVGFRQSWDVKYDILYKEDPTDPGKIASYYTVLPMLAENLLEFSLNGVVYRTTKLSHKILENSLELIGELTILTQVDNKLAPFMQKMQLSETIANIC